MVRTLESRKTSDETKYDFMITELHSFYHSVFNHSFRLIEVVFGFRALWKRFVINSMTVNIFLGNALIRVQECGKQVIMKPFMNRCKTFGIIELSRWPMQQWAVDLLAEGKVQQFLAKLLCPLTLRSSGQRERGFFFLFFPFIIGHNVSQKFQTIVLMIFWENNFWKNDCL